MIDLKRDSKYFFPLKGDNLVANRKGEKHKRIKCSTVAKLMQEITYEESIYNLNDNMSAMGMGDNYSQGMGS